MAKKIEDITKKENTKNTNNKSTEELFIFAKSFAILIFYIFHLTA